MQVWFGFFFCIIFLCQVSHIWGKEKPEDLFHCLLKAVSPRQAQDYFSALILPIVHPFPLFKNILFLK